MVARRLCFQHIDTGAMYRAVAWKGQRLGIDLGDADRVAELAENLAIELIPGPEGQKILVDGQEVTSQLKSEAVGMGAALVASQSRVREILRISQDPLSLDSPVGDDDAMLGDFIEDENAEAPIEVAARHMLGQAVSEALDGLSEREKQVVVMRFGLNDDGRAHTLEEVGREFGVTRERIRQIEAKTLAKLRHPHRSDKLRDYLDDG
jgi:DNA-directed RNA polymerase sigma subunit (sigma70/sigma32)